MLLHVHDTVELVIPQVNVDLDAVGKAVDSQVRAREIAGRWWNCWRWVATVGGITDIALDTFAYTS